MAEGLLYQGKIVLHVPTWLLRGVYRWMLTTDRFLHPTRIEEAEYPMRYRCRLTMPVWAGAICRTIAESSRPGPVLMVLHETSALDGGALIVTGHTDVNGVAIIQSEMQYRPIPDGGCRCTFEGRSLRPKHGVLLARAAQHVEKQIIDSQRHIERTARVCATAALMALRLLETR